MTKYLLSNHVHLRLTDDGAVLLDLRRDEYLTLNRDQASALLEATEGWPASSAGDTPSTRTDKNRSEFSTTLLERGLITPDAHAGKPAIQAELPTPNTSLVEQYHTDQQSYLRYLPSFLTACARTFLSLRLRSLDQIIFSIERRKRRHLSAHGATAEKMEELVRAFQFLRPFVYTDYNKCLFDSLTLVHFLASHGCFPSLVVGIRIRPFEAHAWVQQGRCSLNHAVEYVRAYAPIMII